MDLAGVHKNILSMTRHGDYMDDAQRISLLTIPQLNPKAQQVKVEERPYTAAGTMAVRSLSSSLLTMLMPSGVMWSKWDLLPVLEQLLLDNGFSQDQMDVVNARIDQRAKDVQEALITKNARSGSVSIMRRNLIEGNNAAFNDGSMIRYYPMRDIAVKREANRVHLLSIREVIAGDPMHSEFDIQHEEHKAIYTLIDYAERKVWRQTDPEGQGKEIEDDPDQYWVFTPEVPDIEAYVVGYATNYERLIAQIDLAEARIGQAMTYAALNIPVARQGSIFAEQPDILLRLKPGEIVPDAVDEDLSFITTGAKIRDWEFVANVLSFNREDLAQVFAMGIKDRKVNEAAATTILKIVDELETQIADLLASLDETFLKPMILSEMVLHERVSPLFADVETDIRNLLRITVVTGNASRQGIQTLSQLIGQIFPAIAKLDPTIRFDGDRILKRIGTMLPIKVDDLYTVGLTDPLALPPSASEVSGPVGDDIVMTRGGPQSRSIQQQAQPGSPAPGSPVAA